MNEKNKKNFILTQWNLSNWMTLKWIHEWDLNKKLMKCWRWRQRKNSVFIHRRIFDYNGFCWVSASAHFCHMDAIFSIFFIVMLLGINMLLWWVLLCIYISLQIAEVDWVVMTLIYLSEDTEFYTMFNLMKLSRFWHKKDCVVIL